MIVYSCVFSRSNQKSKSFDMSDQSLNSDRSDTRDSISNSSGSLVNDASNGEKQLTNTVPIESSTTAPNNSIQWYNSEYINSAHTYASNYYNKLGKQ